jgi:magnesium-transporting ATPase (P-type)
MLLDGAARYPLDETIQERVVGDRHWNALRADRANNAVLQECEGRWAVQGDPTEGALIVAARKAGHPWMLRNEATRPSNR